MISSTGNVSTSTKGGRFIGDVQNDQNDPNLQKDNFDFSAKVASTLKTVFGIRNFRPNQVKLAHWIFHVSKLMNQGRNSNYFLSNFVNFFL